MSISVADALTALPILCGAALALRPSPTLLLTGVATDWLDGPLARRGSVRAHGPRFDLEAESLLTLGASIAAARQLDVGTTCSATCRRSDTARALRELASQWS